MTRLTRPPAVDTSNLQAILPSILADHAETILNQDDGAAATVSFDDFMKIDIRCGTITEAVPFPQARKPAFKLVIDFGPDIGSRTSSAQITERYSPETLVGKKVMAVVNFPPRQIGPFMSEVLTLGVANADGEVVLVSPDSDAPDGSRLH